MIVPMKKLLLLTLTSDKNATLEALRRLGVVEVTAESAADTVDRRELIAELAKIDRLIGILSTRSAETGSETLPTGKKLYQLVEERQSRLETLVKERDQLNKACDQLNAWGYFEWTALRKLREKGVNVYLCEAQSEQYELLAAMPDGGLSVVPIHSAHGMVKFAVVVPVDSKFDPSALPMATLPAMSLREAEEAREKNAEAMTELHEKLDILAGQLPELRHFRAQTTNTAEFLLARDSLGEYGEITVLRGYVPEPDTDALRRKAGKQGWGLVLNDPEPGEAVPVLLQPPKWSRPILPLLKFLEISPAYSEFDLSPGMLIFFSIFFSMIINDAGYGLLMLVFSIAASILFRKNPKAKLPCRLAVILSASASVWGMLTGSYFGLEHDPLEFFAPGPMQMENLELVCFTLALVHLSLGRCWRLVNTSGIREVLGQLGWIPILILNFMIIYKLLISPGAMPMWTLYLAGFGLLLIFFGDIDWKNIGALCNFPFDLVGSFTDTLSYVRLFAIGMSGGYMAQSFNEMAMGIWHISPWLIPVAILIMLLGHSLNVALSLMGVLVHGVRLNTLEFSNHANIRWGGRSFKPLEEFRP